jgi:hypothetical protein
LWRYWILSYWWRKSIGKSTSGNKLYGGLNTVGKDNIGINAHSGAGGDKRELVDLIPQLCNKVLSEGMPINTNLVGKGLVDEDVTCMEVAINTQNEGVNVEKKSDNAMGSAAIFTFSGKRSSAKRNMRGSSLRTWKKSARTKEGVYKPNLGIVTTKCKRKEVENKIMKENGGKGKKK